MIYISNEMEYGKCIAIDDKNVFVIDEKLADRNICGIGGITDDNIIIGIYCWANEYFFVCDNRILKITMNNFDCSNSYVNKYERRFCVKIDGKVVFEKQYKPFIDPGIFYYDVDIEEYDYLLQFYNYTKDKENLFNYLKRLSTEKVCD